MNTRFFLTLAVAIVLILPLSAQSLINPTLKSSLDKYISHTNNQEWNDVFSYTYPALFEAVEQDDLKAVMERAYNGMAMHISNANIVYTSAPIEADGHSFIRLMYTADIQVALEPGGIYDHIKPIGAMKDNFVQRYGTQAVTWNEEAKTFAIKAENTMLAIDMGQNDWKFLDLDPARQEWLEQLLPQTVVESLIRVE